MQFNLFDYRNRQHGTFAFLLEIPTLTFDYDCDPVQIETSLMRSQQPSPISIIWHQAISRRNRIFCFVFVLCLFCMERIMQGLLFFVHADQRPRGCSVFLPDLRGVVFSSDFFLDQSYFFFLSLLFSPVASSNFLIYVMIWQSFSIDLGP